MCRRSRRRRASSRADPAPTARRRERDPDSREQPVQHEARSIEPLGQHAGRIDGLAPLLRRLRRHGGGPGRGVVPAPRCSRSRRPPRRGPARSMRMPPPSRSRSRGDGPPPRRRGRGRAAGSRGPGAERQDVAAPRSAASGRPRSRSRRLPSPCARAAQRGGRHGYVAAALLPTARGSRAQCAPRGRARRARARETASPRPPRPARASHARAPPPQRSLGELTAEGGQQVAGGARRRSDRAPPPRPARRSSSAAGPSSAAASSAMAGSQPTGVPST